MQSNVGFSFFFLFFLLSFLFSPVCNVPLSIVMLLYTIPLPLLFLYLYAQFSFSSFISFQESTTLQASLHSGSPSFPLSTPYILFVCIRNLRLCFIISNFIYHVCYTRYSLSNYFMHCFLFYILLEMKINIELN